MEKSASAVAEEWAAPAPLLARWANELTNRTDVHGRYRPLGARRPNPRTGRANASYTAHFALTLILLLAHFRGIDPGDLVGLHVSSPDETCKWVVIDFDAHGEGDDPQANWSMALATSELARARGFDVLLLDSNGGGGYHLWIIFATPISQPDAWRLGKWLVCDHARYGLAKPPETFPKSPHHSGKRIGNWVRLPGRHHTRDHWTRVWDPIRQCWVEGREAIALILAATGRDVDLATVIPADFDPRARQVRRARACVGPVRRRDVALARLALRYLGDDYRDDYDLWLRVGMALSELGEAGLALWHRWSESSPKYEPHVLDEKWTGFSAATGITLRTLFHMAKEEGWAGPPRRVRGILQHRGSFTIRVSRRNDDNSGSQES